MTNYLETHPSESGKQASLFFKIALFRWVTTALIWYIIIPFVNITAYGRDGLIERVYLQFFSDITWGNLLPLLDIVGLEESRYLVFIKTVICTRSNTFIEHQFLLLVVFPACRLGSLNVTSWLQGQRHRIKWITVLQEPHTT